MGAQHGAAGALGALAVLHLWWATGSAWPLADQATLADTVAGRATLPSPAACLGVAAALSTASALVAGRPRPGSPLQRGGAMGVVAVLSVRGALGLAGRTDLVAPGSSSPRFRRLDRRYYAPLCLAIAALASPAARSNQ
jgi:hypothetical protein